MTERTDGYLGIPRKMHRRRRHHAVSRRAYRAGCYLRKKKQAAICNG